MIVELIKEGTSPDPIKAMAIAASKCYDSKPTEGLVDRALQSGHTSIAEHAKFEFNIKGVSRVATHQLVRKRIGFSYAQRSQRYCNEENFDYVLPSTIKESKYKERYVEIMKELSSFYSDMVSSDIPKEDARFVLPNANHTTLILSNNMRSLMDFCKVRMCKRAQWEIRELAYLIKKEVKNHFPFVAKHLKPNCKLLGYCPEGIHSCKGEEK